ncbi:DinB family protein [Nocardioides sp. SYSU D00065]|uniref:mycothiol transferase n=1 Tax=Nocardioides sp. SYSU D00065 TaxID=2817378 RepID=UPI001B323902|nr:DinB family protein [Nocardioides sp. SYSU D00065]
MDVRGVLTEAYGRVTELYDDVADGLDAQALAHRPGGTGNPIGWLLWHLARVQDDHVAGLAGEPQVWERFQDRFGLPNGTDDIGYGHTSEQVAAIRIEDPQLLVEYHHEVTLATARYLQTVDEAELEREVDQSWDPPVTAGVRLVSILGDCLQHLGQAAYVKGLLAT